MERLPLWCPSATCRILWTDFCIRLRLPSKYADSFKVTFENTTCNQLADINLFITYKSYYNSDVKSNVLPETPWSVTGPVHHTSPITTFIRAGYGDTKACLSILPSCCHKLQRHAYGRTLCQLSSKCCRVFVNHHLKYYRNFANCTLRMIVQ